LSTPTALNDLKKCKKYSWKIENDEEKNEDDEENNENSGENNEDEESEDN
jgi:hypothetical protein